MKRDPEALAKVVDQQRKNAKEEMETITMMYTLEDKVLTNKLDQHLAHKRTLILQSMKETVDKKNMLKLRMYDKRKSRMRKPSKKKKGSRKLKNLKWKLKYLGS